MASNRKDYNLVTTLLQSCKVVTRLFFVYGYSAKSKVLVCRRDFTDAKRVICSNASSSEPTKD